MTLGLKTQAIRGRSAGFVPPVSDGCVAWFDLGDAAIAERYLNRLSRAVPPFVVGDPVEQTGYTTMIDSVDYLRNDGVFDTASMTIIALARSTGLAANPARARFLANYATSGGSRGIDFSMTRAYLRLYWNGNSTPFELASAGYASWGLYAVTITSGVGVSLYNLTAATSVTTADAATRVLGTDALRIGSRGPSGTDYQARDLNHVSWWDRALTKAEIDLNAAFIRERAAAKGIVA